MTSRPKRTLSKVRPPTYESGMRIARLVLELEDRPLGWSWDEACETLEVSSRTLSRYLAKAREELVDRAGRPIIVATSRNGARRLQLAGEASAPEVNAYETVSLFFTAALARFLEGSILDQGTGNLLERLQKTIPPSKRRLLDNLDRKLFALQHAPKDYREKDDVLDPILRALLGEHSLAVHYGGLLGDVRTHTFDPYTLLGYRGGLYLLGFSRERQKIICLAVDRIRAVEKTLDDEGRPIRFRYPPAFDPARHTNGMFGIVEGEKVEVELAINNAETEAYLRERRIHPTQRFSPRDDGRTRFELEVRGTTELANWILSLCPYVEVIRPVELREEIRERLGEGLARHQPPRRQPARATPLERKSQIPQRRARGAGAGRSRSS
ncbi:MAG: WYL domain-containing protein [Deltaproteobacteria bacterium]|nr:WYL domain-containing protein [Deltaproteobacteria bacterium]